MAEQFCRKYVDEVFAKWDTDNSNVLSKQELKHWLRAQQKDRPLNKSRVKETFYQMIGQADSNGDGKLDRWQLYEFCVQSYNPNSDN